ncbi:MAG: hypothetical protein Q8P18_34780 [Pseudomonadota bacterium]|nr:hypothetical protein [Pseudomonadota bacterium]
MLIALLSAALAAPAADPTTYEDARVWVGAAVGGGVGADEVPSGGGGAAVEAGVRLGRERRRSLSLVAYVREAMMSTPVRNIGNLGVLVQYPSGTGPHVHLGFSHSHESQLADYLAHPIEVTTGVHSSLTHRTGFEAGAGWDFPPPFPRNRITAVLRPTAAVNVLVFPDNGGPHAYVLAEVGVRFGLDPLFTSSAPASSTP